MGRQIVSEGEVYRRVHWQELENEGDSEDSEMGRAAASKRASGGR